jgi:hypothetical protein
LTRPKIRVDYAIATVVVILVGLAIAFHHTIHNQLNDWKVLPEPEKLTELYFTHPNKLPSSYTPGQPVAVDFTVHDLEYKTENYKYQIIESNNSRSQHRVLGTGSFTLKQNHYRAANVNITTADLGPRVNLEVNLINFNESVDFWVNSRG